MHPTGLDIRRPYKIGYAPMIKVFSNETLMDMSTQLVIHVVYPQLHLYQLHCHHRVSGEGLEVLLVT